MRSPVPDLSIYVPCYQVGGQLQRTLERIPPSIWERLVRLHILDDGSTDDTARIAEQWCGWDSRVVHHRWEPNRGYGVTVRKGLRLGLEDGTPWVACLHGDGQYAPESLPQLLDKACAGAFAIVQGSRHAGGGALRGGMPVYKWVAGHALVFLENRVLKLGLTDYHSGYLLFHRSFLERVPLNKLRGRFEMDLELLACAQSLGVPVGEESIPTHYGDEISHLPPVRYGLRVLRVLGRYLRGAYRP